MAFPPHGGKRLATALEMAHAGSGTKEDAANVVET
jgi:hypothetical protein